MNLPLLRLMILLAVAASAGRAARADGVLARSDAERLLVTQIEPLLAAKCYACHGDDPGELGGGLDLKTPQGRAAGGESGEPLWQAGDPASSRLWQAVRWDNDELQMPPKEADRLTEDQVGWLADWIRAGAPWPDPDRFQALTEAARADASGITVATRPGLTSAWDERRYDPADLWAYQRVIEPAIPGRIARLDVSGANDSGANGSASPVDAFINEALQRSAIQPASRADRVTLIRRATFDLLGLPPSPEEVAAFVGDPRPDVAAFAGLVDRLLASPHYGEQMARHWLDLTRYADTAGLANDFERPNAWRYRDYVIRAFNADLPYSRFVVQQLAGDELDPSQTDHLVAVGFLRMGPWEQTAMSVARITRQQFLDDVTDSVGQVFLAQPLQCCRCHDHKFDPIPTRDYYAMQAVFATTQFAERPAPFQATENLAGFPQEKAYLEQRIERFENELARIDAKHAEAARRWYAERGRAHASPQELRRQGVSEDQIVPRHLGLTTEDFGLQRIASKNLERHRWELDRFRPLAFSVYSGTTRPLRSVQKRLDLPVDPADGQREETAILIGGDPFAPGDSVRPGALSCLEWTDWFRPAEIPETLAGRRLALARWIADLDNPLTSRVIVNRIWQWHFGVGLVPTSNNFGVSGARPSHPELLDWLASTFRQQGGSLKQLHRVIMLSDTYARASQYRRDDAPASEEGAGRYARFLPRRLAAEELRDAMLSVTGELNCEFGGLPVRPELNPDVALQPRQIMGTFAPAYQPSPWPAQRHRRSVYAVRIRGLRDPWMEVFNQPSSDKSCERRETSIVAPQALTLINSPQVFDRAVALAQRLQRDVAYQDVTDASSDRATETATLRRVFQLCFSREPTGLELDACREHWRRMTDRHQRLTIEPETLPRSVVRQAIEEMNGEPFEFVERLEVADDFVPDCKPWHVSAQTRGLAELCLVLLNTNEFVYVP